MAQGIRENIKDEQFGKLTALRPIGSVRGGIAWLLRCECGELVTRVVAQLNASVRGGAQPMCGRCRIEKALAGVYAKKRRENNISGSKHIPCFLDNGDVLTLEDVRDIINVKGRL